MKMLPASAKARKVNPDSTPVTKECFVVETAWASSNPTPFTLFLVVEGISLTPLKNWYHFQVASSVPHLVIPCQVLRIKEHTARYSSV